ncbi:NYN domain-containing protein [Tritonibacter mobilis]|nr:NYN domain-containing protein [Tritonibacter mobilis]
MEKTALFIDAENISHKYIEQIIAKFEHIEVKKAYGNFGAVQLKPWVNICSRFAIEVVYQEKLVKSKSNAADIALTVGVMESLYVSPIDTFAIASSDSDFAALVHFLRRNGKKVIGFGNNTASAKHYFDDFYILGKQNTIPKVKNKSIASVDTYYLALVKEAVETHNMQKLDSLKQWMLVPIFIEYSTLQKKQLGVSKLYQYFKYHDQHFKMQKAPDGGFLVSLH